MREKSIKLVSSRILELEQIYDEQMENPTKSKKFMENLADIREFNIKLLESLTQPNVTKRLQ